MKMKSVTLVTGKKKKKQEVLYYNKYRENVKQQKMEHKKIYCLQKPL